MKNKLLVTLFILSFTSLSLVLFLNLNTETVLKISGSNTMGSQLTPKLVVSFFEQELNASFIQLKSNLKKETYDVTGWVNFKRLKIEIEAKGSSTGFANIPTNQTDIVMSSRPLKTSERINLINLNKGDLLSNKNSNVIGLDGIAIITHPDVMIEELTFTQIAAIFSGKIKNWSELGGQDLAIKVIRRNQNSGTLDIFKEKIMTPNHVLLEESPLFISLSNHELSNLVYQKEGAISFISFSEAGKNKTINVRETPNTPVFKPTYFNISLENYPLSRRLFFYNSSSSSNLYIDSFIDFCISDQGQKIVSQIGFIPLILDLDEYLKKSIPHSTPDYYATPSNSEVTNGALQIPYIVRFKNNSIEFDMRGRKDIHRIIAFLKKYKNNEVILIGFSDNQGEAFTQNGISLAQCNAVKRALIKNGISENQIIIKALGGKGAIASNETKDGRLKNRRVELWIR
jgi:phosphate transport system substrate-binding protein